MNQSEFDKVRDTLAALRRFRIASTFYCDPGIPSRPPTAADREKRNVDSRADSREVLVVIEGTLEYLLADRIYLLGPGDAILADRGEEHQVYYPRETPRGRHFVFNITPEQILHALLDVSETGWQSMLPF